MNKVLCLFPQEWFENINPKIPGEIDIKFKKTMVEDEIIAACQGMDYLLVPAAYPRITEKVIQNIPSIKMIQSAGAGFDKVNVIAAAQMKIPVCNSTGDNSGTVAEFAIAQLITLQRKIILMDRQIKSGDYQAARESFIKSGLKEMVDIHLGLVGFGRIGKKVARFARLCGSQVSYYSPNRKDERTEKEYQVKYLPFDKLLSTCDVISLHLPLNEQTSGIIGQKEIELMPAGCLLLNTSRGELIDPGALAQALESGHLSGAAIDTVHPEPPSTEHPLLNLSAKAKDRLIITPHMAGITKGSIRRLITGALDNIVQSIREAKPANIVNEVERIRGWS